MELDDSYDHNDPNVIYTPENIPTQDTEEEFNQQFIIGCNCEESCSKDKCSCIMKSGTHYMHNLEQNKIQIENIHDDYVINVEDDTKPIYECNSRCACYGRICGNRLVQFGPRKHLKIIACDSDGAVSNKKIKLEISDEKSSNTKGYGLVTTKGIRGGNFICEYAGEIITKKEAIKRHEINAKLRFMNYIFCINEHFGENGKSTFIDPSRIGNIGRYLNHSCQPNCKIIPIRVNNTIPKLCIFAVDDIGEDEELTFDYGSDNNNLFKSTQIKQNRIKCLCQSVKCCQYLPFSEYTI